MRILVAEDQWLIAQSVADALVERGYHPVGPVATVADALLLLEREGCDMAIVDYSLQDAAATPLIVRLTGLGIPVMIISGHGEVPPQAAGVPLLRKPFDLPHLVACVGALLRGLPLPVSAE